MKNCIELDAVDKWIDLRLFRLGQSYLSCSHFYDYRVQGFFCNANLECFFIDNHDFMECRNRVEFAAGVEWMRGTVYNGGEIQGGFADEI